MNIVTLRLMGEFCWKSYADYCVYSTKSDLL